MLKLRVGQSFLAATSMIFLTGCPTAADMQTSSDIQLGEWVFQLFDDANNDISSPTYIVFLDGGQTDYLENQLGFNGTLTWAIDGDTFDMYQANFPFNEFFYNGTLLSRTSMQGTWVERPIGGVVEDSGTWTAQYRYTSI